MNLSYLSNKHCFQKVCSFNSCKSRITLWAYKDFVIIVFISKYMQFKILLSLYQIIFFSMLTNYVLFTAACHFSLKILYFNLISYFFFILVVQKTYFCFQVQLQNNFTIKVQ